MGRPHTILEQSQRCPCPWGSPRTAPLWLRKGSPQADLWGNSCACLKLLLLCQITCKPVTTCYPPYILSANYYTSVLLALELLWCFPKAECNRELMVHSKAGVASAQQSASGGTGRQRWSLRGTRCQLAPDRQALSGSCLCRWFQSKSKGKDSTADLAGDPPIRPSPVGHFLVP